MKKSYSPEKYMAKIKQNFPLHLSYLYLIGIERFSTGFELRVSYCYFLNDVLQDKNSALYICSMLDVLFLYTDT
jgi:hypothetical protein